MEANDYPTRDDVRTSQYMAGRVKRYHTWPVIHQETVDEHSMGVLRIYRQIFGLRSLSVVRYVMDHDLPEGMLGDPPFPVKQRYPKLGEAYREAEEDARKQMGLPTDYSVPDRELRRIKACDLLQMWQFGRAEMRMGNGYAAPIVQDTVRAAVAVLTDEEDRELARRWCQMESDR